MIGYAQRGWRITILTNWCTNRLLQLDGNYFGVEDQSLVSSSVIELTKFVDIIMVGQSVVKDAAGVIAASAEMRVVINSLTDDSRRWEMKHSFITDTQQTTDRSRALSLSLSQCNSNRSRVDMRYRIEPKSCHFSHNQTNRLPNFIAARLG